MLWKRKEETFKENVEPTCNRLVMLFIIIM